MDIMLHPLSFLKHLPQQEVHYARAFFLVLRLRAVSAASVMSTLFLSHRLAVAGHASRSLLTRSSLSRKVCLENPAAHIATATSNSSPPSTILGSSYRN